MNTGKLVVGVTGASGSIYAVRLLQYASKHFDEIYVCLSESAIEVAITELALNIKPEEFSLEHWLGISVKNIFLLDRRDYFTPPASGSFRHDGMVICPCSAGTLGRIANGVSDDLLTRAADVCLKEGRKLILVPRETPLSKVMIRNMLNAADAGATILPASPAWYYNPENLEQLADTVVARILQNLGIEQNIVKQWAKE